MIKALSDLMVYNGISSNSNEILNNKCQMPKVIFGEIVVKTLKNYFRVTNQHYYFFQNLG